MVDHFTINFILRLTRLSYPNRSLTFGLHVGRPEGEVVPEELHDERRVLVALLGQRVQLCDGVVEGGLGEAARAVRRVQDLVVKHRKVEGQAQPERYAVDFKRHLISHPLEVFDTQVCSMYRKCFAVNNILFRGTLLVGTRHSQEKGKGELANERDINRCGQSSCFLECRISVSFRNRDPAF